MTSGDVCNCIAVYDWEKVLPLTVWVSVANQLFAKTGSAPDWANFGRTARSAKVAPFDQIQRKITSDSARGIGVVQAMVTRPGYKQLAFGWRVQAAYNTDKQRTILYCWDDRLFRWSSDWICGVLGIIAVACAPTYGIAYRRAFDQGPALYAYGMDAGLGFGDSGMEEGDRIAAWFEEMRGAKRYTHGLLRDVYPINLLSREHLNAPIRDTTLGNWISADPRHGILRPCSDSTTIWIVTKDVANIRSALETAGLLIR